MRNLHKMGVRSVRIVAVTRALHGRHHGHPGRTIVQRFSATDIIGWGAGFAMLREVGPLLIALMFSGRVGANNTAELGTMVVTEQLDALRALAIDPLTYLIVPRVIAMIVMLFVLNVIGDPGRADRAPYSAPRRCSTSTSPSSSTASSSCSNHWDFMHEPHQVDRVRRHDRPHLLPLRPHGQGRRAGRRPRRERLGRGGAIGIFVMDYFSTFLLQ